MELPDGGGGGGVRNMVYSMPQRAFGNGISSYSVGGRRCERVSRGRPGIGVRCAEFDKVPSVHVGGGRLSVVVF